jgi:hypothetical protein
MNHIEHRILPIRAATARILSSISQVTTDESGEGSICTDIKKSNMQANNMSMSTPRSAPTITTIQA